MNNLTLRAISGTVYVALISICILMGTWPAWILLLVITFFSLWEYKTLLLKELSILQKILFLLTGLFLYAVLSLWQFMYIPSYIYGIVLIVALLPFIVELFHIHGSPFDVIGRQFTGFIYISVSMGLMFGIGFKMVLMNTDGVLVYNSFLLLTVFIMIWCNDTFAYLTGRLLGKNPLFSRVSPKKTVEGLIGGIVFTLILAFVMFKWKHQLSLTEYMIMGLLICIGATLGDLIESLLKRSLDVKDSGKLIPGHGGMLDRIDASLIAVWFAYFYLQII